MRGRQLLTRKGISKDTEQCGSILMNRKYPVLGQCQEKTQGDVRQYSRWRIPGVQGGRYCLVI